MENAAMQVYSNRAFGEVRTVMREGEPWFVAADVCRVLEIKNSTQAIQRLETDERAMLNIGRQGDANIVSECGLYALVSGSRKPEARAFQRWINHEVLPSIRKTGAYARPDLSHDADVVTALITALRHEQDLSAELQRRINWLTSPEGAEMRKHGRLRPAVEALPQRAVQQFTEAVRALAAEEGRICDRQAAPADRTRLIGYEDERYYYLMPAQAYRLAEEWCAQRGEPMLVTQRALIRCLREAKAIQPAVDGSSNTRVTLIGGRAMRVLWLCKLALLAAGERQARLGMGGQQNAR
ncbi:MAG: BRO family protein [Candidatus Limiplasma sp.]|nr:BRO family protein [Candidatus Limiplasma sp.]